MGRRKYPPPGGVGQEDLQGTRRTPRDGGTARDPGETPRGGGNRLGAVYDGVRLQSERLALRGIIRDQGGRYFKASTNPDGTPGFVEVDPVEVERDVTQNIGTKISEAAVNDLNIHMRAVVRKIGLNLTVVHELRLCCKRETLRGRPHVLCELGRQVIKVRVGRSEYSLLDEVDSKAED